MADEYKIQADLHYTKEHEYARVEGEIAVVGIDDYAQALLHEIVYVELPKVGSKAVQGKPLGAVESVKAVSDMYAPVSGEIVEVNEALLDAPDKINTDPYGEGWIAKIKPSSLQADLGRLMEAEKYKGYIATLKH